MPRLLTIKTDLSEYKAPQYGYDRRGAGPRNTNASGQPYEITNLPKRSFTISDYGRTSEKPDEDFLLRGGQLLPSTTLKDVSRLSKMFFDTRSPNGLLFTAKQEVLSRTGVNVLAVSNQAERAQNRRALNNGIYLPTSTLAQAAVNPIGGHLLKQGIDPTASTGPNSGVNLIEEGGLFSLLGITDPLANPTYFDTVAFKERKNNSPSSRLIKFLDFNIETNTQGENELYNYSGGPDSVLGVGKTAITMLSDQRTGRNNASLSNIGFFDSTNFGYFNYGEFKRKTVNFEGARYFNNNGVSNTYENLTGIDVFNNQFKTTSDEISGNFISDVGQSVFQSGSFTSNPAAKGLGTTLNYNELQDSGTNNVLNDKNEYIQVQDVQDFRQKRTNKGANSLNYTGSTNRIEGRVNLGNPGSKNTSKSYVTGNTFSKNGLDKINALSLYRAANVDHSKDINDLCKFRIGVIDNNDPSLKTYIHFRAFLDDMSDEYQANWGAEEFAGRAEKLYNYQGFDRTFNLSWTVVAQSKQELIPMYQKLNYLASVCGPDYSNNGYMRGNLIELTVGGYLFNQVGIMQGINYTIPMESPWEIAIPDEETRNELGILSDPSVKELPFMIKVSGFSFIPIHNFVPTVQKNVFSEVVGDNVTTKGEIKTFGPERYIALSNGFSTNYTPTNQVTQNRQSSGASQNNQSNS